MSTTASTATITASRVLPGHAAPELDLPVAGGGHFRLSDSRPRLFTMVVFNRGLHCPVCRAQLSELNRRIDELAERGIEIVSVSGETADRAERMRTEWGIDRVSLAYAFTEPQMRAWGLFVSHAIKDDEPPVFDEPGLFLIRPDGTVSTSRSSRCRLGVRGWMTCSAGSRTGPSTTTQARGGQ